MGQNQSAGSSDKDKDGILTDITDCIQFQVQKHRKILTQLNDLTYEEFQKCLSELNDLSRKCLDPDGKQLVFAVKKGTDSTILWKATTRIACVKVDPISRKIDNFKLINLKQFLQVFHTMTTNLEAINTYEEKQRSNSNSPSTTSQVHPNKLGASYVLNQIENTFNFNEAGTSDDSSEQSSECCICLERKPEIILPCLHSYCAPCIEQWNTEHKSCPLCNERLKSTDDTWVIQDMPDNFEIHEEICSILMKLSNDDKKD